MIGHTCCIRFPNLLLYFYCEVIKVNTLTSGRASFLDCKVSNKLDSQCKTSHCMRN